MLKKIMTPAVLLLNVISLACLSAEFTGAAIHQQQQAAKEQALSDLQQNIYVNVESSSHSFQSNKGDNHFEFSSSLSSTLPLLGALTECYEAIGQWQCESKLTSAKSSELYRATVVEKQQHIEQLWQQIKAISSPQVKYDELAKLLPLLQETQQLILVLKMLNPDADITLTKVSSAQVSQEIVALEQTAKSLPMAAKLLSKNIADHKKILVKAFTPYHHHDITPFASALQSQLNNQLNTVSSENSATYTLQGKYRINKTTLQVESQLIDNHGNIVNASVVNIEKSATAGQRFEPQGNNFEQLLISGQVISNDFAVKLNTNRGSRDLLFRDSETVKLLIKVNQPSHYYIVGHTTNNTAKKSYLLDLNDAPGNEKFIQYLGTDEVNRWVVIGEFEIAAPFGKESLQVFASTTKPLDLLPQTSFDGDYFIITGKKADVVAKTRGLVRKKKAKTNDGKVKRQVSEAVLTMTTVK